MLNNQDELNLYRGIDYPINNYIVIKHPTLGDICDYGEQEYFSMVHTICSVGADMKWQLDDLGIDYTKISDFELFSNMLVHMLTKSQTKILLGDTIDFSQMQIMFNAELQENVLVQFFDTGENVQIDRYVYSAIVDAIRKIHRFKRNDELPGNESSKQILIEDAREAFEENQNKPYKSFLLPLISSMVNSEGFKYNNQNVFDMKIYPFMDAVQRIEKIKNAKLLMQSGYSGFGIDLKKVDKDTLNWMGELS